MVVCAHPVGRTNPWPLWNYSDVEMCELGPNRLGSDLSATHMRYEHERCFYCGHDPVYSTCAVMDMLILY